ncbi:hypothetical protein K1T71_000714 [Dendrolimus kikuchii]|uniref:Uncharacterized protein n=1 Tax=Dendrolimus kikuchii TaxID=765133 RepID=A0ACC1DL29_9NEOP|nr:hypothetical protein K1T71_000714 [Dendrolimus kikuchii]
MSSSVINNANSQEILTPIVHACVCCLAEKVTFVKLEKCLHKQFLIEFFKNETDFKCKVVCLSCHNFLLKIEKFKQMIKESIILSVQHTKNSTKALTWLRNSAIHVISVIPIYSNNENISPTVLILKEDVKHDHFYRTQETDKEPSVNKFRQPEDRSKDVLEDKSRNLSLDQSKCVPEDKSSDCSVDIDIKTETDYIKNPESFATPPDNSLYSGRIRIVTLTPEQVLAEREISRRQPSYANKDFQCDLCIKGFVSKRALDSHMEKHDEKQGPAMCPICKSYQRTDVSLKTHYKRHFTRYECVICGLRFMTETCCGGHYNSAHGDKHGVLAFGFTCNKCDYVTDCYRSFTHHKHKHKKVSRECKECYKTFTTASGYSIHMRNFHTDEKPVFNCKVCGKIYQSPSSLHYHMASKHKAEGGKASRTHCCADCKTVYTNRQGLVAHLRTHSKHANKGEAKLTCHDCGSKFHNKPEIKRHIYLNHMPINKCPLCLKAFSMPRCLKTHVERVHLGKEAPRDKICQYCGKAFTTNVILQAHIRTHTLERPLKCPHCPATFAHSAARYNHKKLVHNPNRVRKAKTNQKCNESDDNK